MDNQIFLLSKLSTRPAFDDVAWDKVSTLLISNVHEASSDHAPKTELKLGYTDDGLCGKFIVADRYVRSTAEKFQDSVCIDSCVEAFLQPGNFEDGYLNFEMNCGGTLLVHWVKKVWFTEAGERKTDSYNLTEADIAGVEIVSSLPKINDPEIATDLTWSVEFFIPFALFERVGPWKRPTSNTVWHANFYKCGDNTSHPHWLSWAPIGKLNFHAPEFFQAIKFI